MAAKLKDKSNKIIDDLRSQPYQKRLLILRISLVVVLCLLLAWWFYILKNSITENPSISSDKIEENNKKKNEEVSHWEVFTKGALIIYQNNILPFFKKVGDIVLSLFSNIVGIVIEISQAIFYVVNQITIQFKAYIELISSFLKQPNFLIK
jgi:hypothetical protein